ncbi:MAG: hypothetical protein H5T65_13455 [Chloroflexi bacterium]|nr:hypothetical protein [Chloroflexota bacterium]
MCHKRAGATHQVYYEELYQDGVIKVSDIAYSFTPPDTSKVSFKLTKNGAPFDVRQADSWGVYFVPYADSKFQFEPARGRLSLKGKTTYDGQGVATTVVTGTTNLAAMDGLIVVYGTDEIVGSLPARIRQGKYPFVGMKQTGKGVDYTSPANVAGCEKCHTVPYLKHGYIYAQVDGDPATDFYTCKVCHLDNGEGGHFEWQLLVTDPAKALPVLESEENVTPEIKAQFAYKTTVMNDVHMSHAMEFPYPQSMANCVTCHEGKLDKILADANFKTEVCKSCHPVTTVEGLETPAPALKAVLPSPIHDNLDLNTVDCTTCHGEGKAARGFSKIHTGYDQAIYTASGQKYSDAIKVSIDSASFADNKLTFAFSATEDPDLEGVNAADIVPTVLVSLYGWDTKDFVLGGHERLVDTNGDGKIDRSDQPILEAALGEEHANVTVTSVGAGKWEATFDLSKWADLLTNGSVKRAELAVMPALKNADGVMVALVAPSRTFDFGANAFDDNFNKPIVKVADGCDNCHAALGTTFHSPDRGGNAVVCRMCHITKSGAAHLEMQSRSLDSYIHATHAGQPYDVGRIDFADPVQAMHYEHHVEFPFPTHGITNCEACHVKGTYEAASETQSLPGLLSAAATLTNRERSIGAVPSYVTGPGSRACGGCHRAFAINEDAVAELVAFNVHTQNGGYLVEAGENPVDTLMKVIDEVMGAFK